MRRLFHFTLEGLQHALAGLEIGERHAIQQPALKASADPRRAHRKLAPGAREMNAPRAAVTFSGGTANGNLIAATFSGSATIAYHLFTGCLPTAP